MKKNAFILLVFIMICACREPFDFGYAETEVPTVVIDGFLTDQAAAHKVRVSYTNRVGAVNNLENAPIENAIVVIEDEK